MQVVRGAVHAGSILSVHVEDCAWSRRRGGADCVRDGWLRKLHALGLCAVTSICGDLRALPAYWTKDMRRADRAPAAFILAGSAGWVRTSVELYAAVSGASGRVLLLPRASAG